MQCYARIAGLSIQLAELLLSLNTMPWLLLMLAMLPCNRTELPKGARKALAVPEL